MILLNFLQCVYVYLKMREKTQKNYSSSLLFIHTGDDWACSESPRSCYFHEDSTTFLGAGLKQTEHQCSSVRTKSTDLADITLGRGLEPKRPIHRGAVEKHGFMQSQLPRPEPPPPPAPGSSCLGTSPTHSLRDAASHRPSGLLGGMPTWSPAEQQGWVLRVRQEASALALPLPDGSGYL